MKVLHPLAVAVALLPLVAAQKDEEYERRLANAARRDNALSNLKAGKPLVTLEWRRDAAGAFEFRAPDDAKAEFAPWFEKGIADAVNCTGLVGPIVVPLHNGDVLSLTHSEHHLRRLGISSATAELVKFVRSPLPEQLGDVALLDRMVAIDLLARRGEAELQVLAADTTLAAPLRERAATANPNRRRLDAATLALPASCDLIMVCNHGLLFDALPLIEVGYFTRLLSSLQVIQKLKAPFVSDFVRGQTESEFVTGLPFEVALRFGNFRLDQTVIALGSKRSGLFITSAGSFSPAAMVAGVPALGIDGAKAELTSDCATGRVGGVELVVTDFLAVAKSEGLAVAADADLAARLLGGESGLRVRVPEGSSLLAELDALGIRGVASIDATASFGDMIVVDATLHTKDHATAASTAAQVKDQLLRMGAFGWPVRFALAMNEQDPRTVVVEGSDVRVRLDAQRANYPTMDMLRQRLIRQHLR